MSYQDEVKQYAIKPTLEYLTLGLIGEIGELAEKVKRVLRASRGLEELVGDEGIALELGDICWYAFMIANHYEHRVSLNVTLVGCSPSEVPELISSLVRKLPFIFDEGGAAIDDLVAVIYFLGNALGMSLRDICQMNLSKLRSRMERGKIQGDGDHR